MQEFFSLDTVVTYINIAYAILVIMYITHFSKLPRTLQRSITFTCSLLVIIVNFIDYFV